MAKRASTGVAISDYDLAELRSLYPLCNFDAGFTGQQERFLLMVLRGMSPRAAATSIGMSPDRGAILMGQPHMQAAFDLLRDRTMQEITITRDRLNGMLLEAHAKAATATEEITAIRELGKMNGLYAAEKTMNLNVAAEITDIRQIQALDDRQLMEMAGSVLELDPADYSEVTNE